MPNPGPTANQKAFLSKHGIVIPPLKTGATSLIRYITKDKGIAEEPDKDRIDIVKKLQQEWIGKRVTHGMSRGTVSHLVARNPKGMRAFGGNLIDPCPLQAHVIFDEGKQAAAVSLRSLKILPEQ